MGDPYIVLSKDWLYQKKKKACFEANNQCFYDGGMWTTD